MTIVFTSPEIPQLQIARYQSRFSVFLRTLPSIYLKGTTYEAGEEDSSLFAEGTLEDIKKK